MYVRFVIWFLLVLLVLCLVCRAASLLLLFRQYVLPYCSRPKLLGNFAASRVSLMCGRALFRVVVVVRVVFIIFLARSAFLRLLVFVLCCCFACFVCALFFSLRLLSLF